MSEPVVIVGLGADGVERSTRSRSWLAIRTATFLAGGRRHLQLVGPTDVETLAITDNIDVLLDRLKRRGAHERCVVLASGDPLFFGIADRILQALGRDQVHVETHLSSMQLAFARVGLPWHDAAIASVHGRPLKPTLLPLLGRSRIGLFTRDGASPSEVARFFLDRERADDYDAWVCENLDTKDEKVIAARLSELVDRRFADLNVMVLGSRSHDHPFLEPNDEAFAQPESGAILLTHEDVRALVVRRFQALGDGPIWDLGAGLGGVSVALARGFPTREIVAVERSPVQTGFLKTNRSRFETYNIRIVAGEAPECLKDEESPAGVFLGGSGGHLDPILNLVIDRLRPGGRFVANFVGLENLTRCCWVASGVSAGACELTPCDPRDLGRDGHSAGLTTLVPQRPVWIVRAREAGGGSRVLNLLQPYDPPRRPKAAERDSPPSPRMRHPPTKRTPGRQGHAPTHLVFFAARRAIGRNQRG